MGALNFWAMNGACMIFFITTNIIIIITIIIGFSCMGLLWALDIAQIEG